VELILTQTAAKVILKQKKLPKQFRAIDGGGKKTGVFLAP